MKKKLLLCFLFFLWLGKLQAQYVNIPDPVFRNYIDSIVPGSIVGTTLNTTHPGLQNVYYIVVQYMGITDLTGVQYFPNLTDLYCDQNFLTFLPPLPPNLQWLSCYNNQLTSLPALPSQLYQLSCGNNQLTSLPALPNNLGELWCDHNQLTSLPTLPSQLYMLGCGFNQLTSLPTLPNSLSSLSVSGNPNIWCIPNLPTNPNFYSDITLVCTPQGTPDTWFRMTDSPFPRSLATAFSIGTKCYLGTGYSYSDLWEFDPATNVWTQKANLPATSRLQATSFSIGNKGYLGLGQGGSPTYLYDFWEYDPVTNTWLQKANYPGTGYFGNIAFSIGSKGYVGCGQGPGYTFPTTFYEFDPALNTWTPRANFIGVGRSQAACFSIGSKGYVCGGDWYNGLTNTCYSYNPSTNSWIQIASFPWAINEAASFSINGKGFVAAGQCCIWNGTLNNTLTEYDTLSNSWIQRASIPTYGRARTVGCAANGRGYVGTGTIYANAYSESYTTTGDWWEYTPWCIAPSTVIAASGSPNICSGDSVMLFAATGNSYQWKRDNVNIVGATSYFYYATTPGIYSCTITNACTTLPSNQVTVIVHVPITALVTAGGPTSFCNASVTLSATTGTGFTYQWRNGTAPIAGATLSTYVATTSGSYDCIVTNGCGNFTSNNIAVIANTWPTATITAGGPTTFCAPGSVTLNANTGPGLSYDWFLNNAFIPGAHLSSYTATAQGNYRCRVTNLCGNILSGTISVTVLTVPPALIAAGGPTTFCTPGSVTLNANTGTGLSYQWILNNTTITGATLFNYAANASGNYSCIVTNICGSATSNNIAVTVNPQPGVPGSITGLTTSVCSTIQPYSISPVLNATSYSWIAPPGASVSSGQGTPNANIFFTSLFTGGTISVTASNSCGTSPASLIAVSGAPAIPGTITGPVSVCHNQNNVIYSILPVPGAGSYTWTVPPGAHIKQGQGTIQIRIRFGNSAGNITVTANNACSQSAAQTLAVAMPCREGEGFGNNDFNVALYPNPATNQLSIINEQSSIERVEIFDVLGQRIFSQEPEAYSQQLTINISTLPKGIYFAEIISGNRKKVLQFIKKE